MSFAEAVAARTERSVSEAEAVMLDFGVQPQPTGAAPVSLTVDRLSFSGTKRREGRDDEPFTFDRALGPGFWAVTSEVANLAGKSTVLLVIRWALTGRSRLMDDVQDWIERVELEGRVAGERFSIRIDTATEVLTGRLVSASAPAIEFTAANFEEVMDGFFLDRLRLDPTPFWQRRGGGGADEGDRRRFGWQSFFPAVHLRAENRDFLLGDQALGGHAGALMQVFLGLPWALTVATARVAGNEVQMRRSARDRRAAEDRRAKEALLAPLRAELETAQEELARLRATSPALSPAEADRRLQAFSVALGAHRASIAAAQAAEVGVELSQDDVDDAVKRMQALEQSRVVRPLLGRLAPIMCPRCNVAIASGRITREAEEHDCSVCSEPLMETAPDEDELAEASEAVSQAEAQHTTAVEELEAARRRRVETAAAGAEAERLVRELENRRPAEAEARTLEQSIARLEGRLEQTAAESPPDVDTELDAADVVLRAAREEATARRGAAAAQLLTELGEEIVNLGRAFGISNLEAAVPRLNAQLGLRIGGADTNFSSRSGGERLRLRLATVIGLLRVGERLGIGRHPGLLLVDSPGGEEMVEGDVATILRQLKAVCDDVPELQVVVATARAAEVREVVDEVNIIHGPNYGEVW